MIYCRQTFALKSGRGNPQDFLNVAMRFRSCLMIIFSADISVDIE